MLKWKQGQPPLGKVVLFAYYGGVEVGYADDLDCMSDDKGLYICDAADVNSYVEL